MGGGGAASADEGGEIAENRNIDPRDSVVKDQPQAGAISVRRLSQAGACFNHLIADNLSPQNFAD